MRLEIGIALMMFLGAALGSFANVLIVRLKEGSSIGGRSRCPSCKKTIPAKYNIPLVSWFVLKARCAMCGKKIHWQYPVVEIAMALFAVIAFLRHIGEPIVPGWWSIGFELLVAFSLLVITAMDLRWQLVPLEFTVSAAMVVGAIRVFRGDDIVTIILGALTVAFVLGLLVLASRGAWMGEGDPVVGLLVGTTLGFPLALVGIVLAFVIGGTVAAALLLQGAVTRKSHVPFVPFLAAGTLIAIWWQGPILSYFYAF